MLSEAGRGEQLLQLLLELLERALPIRSGRQPESDYLSRLERARRLLPHVAALLRHANHVDHSGRGGTAGVTKDFSSASLSVARERSQQLRANVAYTYELRGEYSEAKAFYESLVNEHRGALGNRPPAILSALHDLGRLLHACGNAEEAYEKMVDAYNGTRAVLGREHPYAVSSLHQLAIIQKSRGKADEAYEAMLEAQ